MSRKDQMYIKVRRQILSTAKFLGERDQISQVETK